MSDITREKALELAKHAGYAPILHTRPNQYSEQCFMRLCNAVRADFIKELLGKDVEPPWYHGVDLHGVNHFYSKDEVRPSEFSTSLLTTTQAAAIRLQERDKWEQDALRYRWFRSQCDTTTNIVQYRSHYGKHVVPCHSAVQMDAAIDNAIRNRKD